MPYLTDEDKKRLNTTGQATSPGDLNYMITILVKSYLESKGTSYQTINDVLGALEGCKLEFYRRVVTDYENFKIKINGDVY